MIQILIYYFNVITMSNPFQILLLFASSYKQKWMSKWNPIILYQQQEIFSYIFLNLMYYLQDCLKITYDKNSFDIIFFVLFSYLLVSSIYTIISLLRYQIYFTRGCWLWLNNYDAILKIFTINIVQNIYCCFWRIVHKRISYYTRKTTYFI